MKYRRKPEVVGAALWDGKTMTPDLRAVIGVWRYEVNYLGGIRIETYTDICFAHPGQYVVLDRNGELRSIEKDAFEAIYEPLEDNQ